MKDEFLEYLYHGNCITEKQKEELFASSGEVEVNYDLLGGNFKLLEIGRISESVLQCVQLIIDLDLLSIEQIEDKLLNYDLDKQLESLTVKISEGEEATDTFINAFISGFLFTAKELSDYMPLQGESETGTRFHCDCLCYQKLEGDRNFLIGIVSDMKIFESIAEEFYVKIMPDGYKGMFSGEREDTIDAMLEFLNNANSMCTYASNPGFNLLVPEYTENVYICAEEIHKINFSLHGNTFAFIIIPDWGYYLEEGE